MNILIFWWSFPTIINRHFAVKFLLPTIALKTRSLHVFEGFSAVFSANILGLFFSKTKLIILFFYKNWLLFAGIYCHNPILWDF